MKKLALVLTIVFSCLYGGMLFAQESGTTYFNDKFDDDLGTYIDSSYDDSDDGAEDPYNEAANTFTENIKNNVNKEEASSEAEPKGSATRNTGTSSDTYKGAVFGGGGLKDGADSTKTNLDSSVAKTKDLKKLIGGWTNFLLGLAAALTLVAVVWAGLLYVTSFVDEGQAEKAKKILIYLVMGILLI